MQRQRRDFGPSSLNFLLRCGRDETASDGLICRCSQSSRFHHPLDVIAFAAYALIIVEEGDGDGKDGTNKSGNDGIR
jgi:hypothetical protein